jgi:uncharacterized membrane protein
MLQSPPVTSPPPSSTWRRLVESPAVPVAILVAFAGLVAATITRFSSWIDESASLLLVGPNNYAEISHRISYDVHPPLWYFILKTWFHLFGVSTLASRSLSAVCMITACGVWYHLIRTRFARPVALLTLALMVTNPSILHYAVEGRMYAFGVLLIAVSCLLITGHWRWRWVAYWPCAVAMLYTHYFLAFPLLAQFLYLALRRREQGISLLWILLYGASICVGYVPWVPYALRQTTMVVTQGFWIGPVTPSAVLNYILLAFLYRGDGNLASVRVFPGVLYLIMWVAALTGVGRAARDGRGPYMLLGLIVGVPWLCLFLVSCVRPVFDPRYVLFGVPALLSLLAAGALALAGRWKPVTVIVLLLGHLWAVKELRYRGFSETRGFFTMKKIAREVSQPVDGELPWIVATWPYGFYDARATLDSAQNVKLLLGAKPAILNTDTMVYYNHPEWIALSLSEVHARYVWIISPGTTPPIEVPANWTQVIGHRRGYADTRLYSISALDEGLP